MRPIFVLAERYEINWKGEALLLRLALFKMSDGFVDSLPLF